jgi:hypothetical protein
MNYFSDDELRCKCGCNELIFDSAVRVALNTIRMEYGKPMVVTSRLIDAKIIRLKPRSLIPENIPPACV